MIASLPMYWRDENADAWRAMWRDLQAAGRGHGVSLPDLTDPADMPEPWTDHWLRDDLVLSQTCSMPLRTALRDRVRYVGSFDFGLNAPIGHYFSRFFRPKRPSGGASVKTLAINSFDSQSGYVVGLEPLVGADDSSAFAKRARDEFLVTGSHRASLQAVAEARADGCYLDAVTYRLCKTYDSWDPKPYLSGKTPPTPGLPLITSKTIDPRPLRAALRDVFLARPDWIGSADLGGLSDFVVLNEASYYTLPIPPEPVSLP